MLTAITLQALRHEPRERGRQGAGSETTGCGLRRPRAAQAANEASPEVGSRPAHVPSNSMSCMDPQIMCFDDDNTKCRAARRTYLAPSRRRPRQRVGRDGHNVAMAARRRPRVLRGFLYRGLCEPGRTLTPSDGVSPTTTRPTQGNRRGRWRLILASIRKPYVRHDHVATSRHLPPSPAATAQPLSRDFNADRPRPRSGAGEPSMRSPW
jgi:hypothetical protein